MNNDNGQATRTNIAISPVQDDDHVAVPSRADKTYPGPCVSKDDDDARLAVVLGACTRILWNHLYNPESSSSHILDQLAEYLQNNDGTRSCSVSLRDDCFDDEVGSRHKSSRHSREEDAHSSPSCRAHSYCTSHEGTSSNDVLLSCTNESDSLDNALHSRRARKSRRKAEYRNETIARPYTSCDPCMDEGECGKERDVNVSSMQESDDVLYVDQHEHNTRSSTWSTPGVGHPPCITDGMISVNRELSMDCAATVTEVITQAGQNTETSRRPEKQVNSAGTDWPTSRHCGGSSSSRCITTAAVAEESETTEASLHTKHEQQLNCDYDICSEVCTANPMLVRETSATASPAQEQHYKSHSCRRPSPSLPRQSSCLRVRSQSPCHRSSGGSRNSSVNNNNNIVILIDKNGYDDDDDDATLGCGRSRTLSPTVSNSHTDSNTTSTMLRRVRRMCQIHGASHTLDELSPNPCGHENSCEVSFDLGVDSAHSVSRELPDCMPKPQATKKQHQQQEEREQQTQNYRVSHMRRSTPPPPSTLSSSPLPVQVVEFDLPQRFATAQGRSVSTLSPATGYLASSRSASMRSGTPCPDYIKLNSSHRHNRKKGVLDGTCASAPKQSILLCEKEQEQQSAPEEKCMPSCVSRQPSKRDRIRDRPLGGGCSYRSATFALDAAPAALSVSAGAHSEFALPRTLTSSAQTVTAAAASSMNRTHNTPRRGGTRSVRRPPKSSKAPGDWAASSHSRRAGQTTPTAAHAPPAAAPSRTHSNSPQIQSESNLPTPLSSQGRQPSRSGATHDSKTLPRQSSHSLVLPRSTAVTAASRRRTVAAHGTHKPSKKAKST